MRLLLLLVACKGGKKDDSADPTGASIRFHHEQVAVFNGPAIQLPVTSGDGNALAAALVDGTGVRVVVVRGGQQTTVDQTDSALLGLAIDDDASVVATIDTTTLRVNGVETLVTEHEVLAGVGIPGDGSAVLFLVIGDTHPAGDPSTEMNAGVWAVDPDGSNLRHVLSREHIAELGGGVPEFVEFKSYVAGRTLHVAADGSAVAVVCGVAGNEALFVAPLDGGTIRFAHAVPTFYDHIAVAPDGESVAWVARTAIPNSSPTQFETWLGWERLADEEHVEFETGEMTVEGPVSVDATGDWVLMGSVLFATDESAVRDVRGGWFLGSDLIGPSMDRSGTVIGYAGRELEGVQSFLATVTVGASEDEVPEVGAIELGNKEGTVPIGGDPVELTVEIGEDPAPIAVGWMGDVAETVAFADCGVNSYSWLGGADGQAGEWTGTIEAQPSAEDGPCVLRVWAETEVEGLLHGTVAEYPVLTLTE